MSSKDSILKNVRKHLPQSTELPDLKQDWITYDDRWEQFQSVLEFVGGQAISVRSEAEATEHLKTIPQYASATKICSLVNGVGSPTFDFSEVADPHDLEDVDFAVLPGEFAVAENGAVWVTDNGIKHRAIYFIPQHIAIVVRGSSPAVEMILDNMHQAYERLQFNQAGFGVFISGPSKTADIEQSLVIGAHGARSLSVIFLQD